MRASKSVPRMPTVAVEVTRRLVSARLLTRPVTTRRPPLSRLRGMLSFFAWLIDDEIVDLHRRSAAGSCASVVELHHSEAVRPGGKHLTLLDLRTGAQHRADSPARCAAPAPRTYSDIADRRRPYGRRNAAQKRQSAPSEPRLAHRVALPAACADRLYVSDPAVSWPNLMNYPRSRPRPALLTCVVFHHDGCRLLLRGQFARRHERLVLI